MIMILVEKKNESSTKHEVTQKSRSVQGVREGAQKG